MAASLLSRIRVTPARHPRRTKTASYPSRWTAPARKPRITKAPDAAAPRQGLEVREAQPLDREQDVPGRLPGQVGGRLPETACCRPVTSDLRSAAGCRRRAGARPLCVVGTATARYARL